MTELQKNANPINGNGHGSSHATESRKDGITRHDWTRDEVIELLSKPLLELVDQAREVHRRHHEDGTVQLASLLSIKTGACPEDCAYCPQSAHYAKKTGMQREALLDVEDVLAKAKLAKDEGATRFCMGAAWREVKDGEDFDNVLVMVKGVRQLGMEACVTLGMLSQTQADRLAEAGLTAYNHNLDTSPEFYGAIVTTRTYQDRLETLKRVRRAGVQVCCGGIIGMGESIRDRARLLETLANLDPHPESVPVNALVSVRGHAAGGHAAGRSARSGAHGGGGADHDAVVARAAFGGAPGADQRSADPLLPRRRQFDLLRRQTSDHWQSRHVRRSRPDRPGWLACRRRRNKRLTSQTCPASSM